MLENKILRLYFSVYRKRVLPFKVSFFIRDLSHILTRGARYSLLVAAD
jgi:hypothetical protein